MSDASSQEFFDVRAVNLTKVTKAIDLQIVIEECNFALNSIEQQMSQTGFGGADWRSSAERARTEYSHRKRLAAMKLAALEADRKSTPQTSPELALAKRFMEAAKEILPDGTYEAIFCAAGAKKMLRPVE